MQYFVTGATGFIGGKLINKLISSGNTVIAYVRPKSNFSKLQEIGVKVICGELTDEITLNSAIETSANVIHIGGPGLAEIVSGKSRHDEEISTLIKVCERKKVSRFVYLSSLKARSPTQHTKKNIKTPTDLYGLRKYSEEKILIENNGQLKWTIIRAPAVYGPSDKKSLPLFRLAKGKYVLIISDLSGGNFSMIHVNDLVKSMISACIFDSAVGQIIEVGHDEVVNWNIIMRMFLSNNSKIIYLPSFLFRWAARLADIVSFLFRKPLPLTYDRVLDFTSYNWISDLTNAKKHLLLESEVSLETGLNDTANWYVEERML